MAAGTAKARDLSEGVAVEEFAATGMVDGVLGDEPILLVRTPAGFRAVGALCTHNKAPLAKGVMVGDTIRCPWHHACFSADTGNARAAPAFAPLGRWAVEQRGGRVFVGAKHPDGPVRPEATREPIVVVGAGAAGAAAADALCRLGAGSVTTLIGAEPEPPYDRTTLTKHFLSGQKGEEALPLPMPDLAARGVTVRLGTTVVAIHRDRGEIVLSDGTVLPYGKLILATGAEPRRLDVPGADLPHVKVLRTAADARAILAAAETMPRVAVVGGAFIGMEAAAALRDRGLEVAVISPDPQPLAKALGTALSDAVMAAHHKRGTTFRLGRSVQRIEPGRVTLDDGSEVPADLVVVGVGVSPRLALAQAAGLTIDEGVEVDEFLRTSDPAIFAVGDIARWPDPHGAGRVRVEHWAVAQRQGQIAAANALGAALRYDAVPFFWTMHFDFSARAVGHAGKGDGVSVEGDPKGRDATIRFTRDGADTATVTVERDKLALEAELAMEERAGGSASLLPAGV